MSAGREGEETHMKSMRCIHKWATGIVALGLAAGVAPISRAQAQSQNSSAAAPSASAPSSTATSSTETQKQLDNLQKQLTELQTQIAALKQAQSAPAVKTASMSNADASPSASEPAATPAADDAPAKISLASLLGPTQITGLVDAYYQFNNNHPFDNESGFRYFDQDTNAFSLNMAEIGVLKAPDASSTDARFGYHIVAGYGDAAYAVNSSDPATDRSNFYLEQAYGSYLAPIGKGLQIDVGKFVTPIGAEVIESSGNWNYSRSMLFYYAIPYYHVGARATYTFNPKWTVAAYLVNGWNNTIICHECFGNLNVGGSAGLTYIGSVTWTPNAKWSVIENYTGGPIIGAYQANLKSINDWKQLWDSVISYTPNAKWAFMLNGDYGFGPKYYSSEVAPEEVSPSVKWWGVAGYAKYTLSAKSYTAVRYEYYDDTNGYTGLLGGDNGHAQEVTGTYAYNLTSGLQVRGEYRYDLASEPFFLAGASAFKQTQQTAELGFIYSFSSVNAK